ncbi:trihelix transcription factor GTL1 [Ipomoea triloba]|uniref:trihelix transcription factor GTL1 n=1 Tax=Ipomoea triloba TaxID=35885 RepID=UPI00125E2F7F|nr:trihelix transcription factor GTL1 [Ipomoea triloba]
MEFLTADGRLPNGVVPLPDHFTPFPEPTDELFLNPTAAIHPPIFAPCKRRRSVRSRQGRNLTMFPEPEPSCGGDDASLSCNAGELGLLVQTTMNNGAATSECPVALTPASDVAVAGNGCPATEVPIELQMKSEIDAQFTNIISQARALEAELSFSSDDSDSSEGEKGPDGERGESKKQKFALFLEDMVRKVMDKQEQMHKQLIELMEKNEQERILREEDWKQQEIERAKRDAELRSQETSRSMALLSFLKNFLGEEIQVPSAQVSCPENDENSIHGQEAKHDSSNRRWPKSEVQALITVRLALDDKFQNGPKGSIWEEVAAGLATMGYTRTPRKCKEKWENINKYYKKMTKSVKSCPKLYKSCPYFRELDILYSKGLVAPVTENDVEDAKEMTLECGVNIG